MNAPAIHALPLITCERGLGRLQASSCAKRWRAGNCAPSSLPPVERMGAAAIRSSPCRACPHGEARAKSNAHLAQGPLIRASELGLVAPHVERRQERAQRQAKPSPIARAVSDASPTPAAPKPSLKASAPARRCVVCDAELEGRALHACPGKCARERERRWQVANYWRKRGDVVSAEAAMRGELPSGRRMGGQRGGTAHAGNGDRAVAPTLPERSSTFGQFDESAESPKAGPPPGVDERPVAPAAATAEPALGPYPFIVRVHGVPVKCRTLDDVVALVERYGAQKAKPPPPGDGEGFNANQVQLSESRGREEG